MSIRSSMSIRCSDSCDCYDKRSQRVTKVTEGNKRSFNSMAEIIGRTKQFAAAKKQNAGNAVALVKTGLHDDPIKKCRTL